MIVVIEKLLGDGHWTKVAPPRAVRAAVIHIAEGTERGTDQHFLKNTGKTSAHFMAGLDGELRQYTSIHNIANHAGKWARPTWPGFVAGQVNKITIGIEHEGSGLTAWPEAQMLTSTVLGAWLAYRFKWTVDAMHFPLHNEIRATKTCPGPMFKRDLWLDRVRAILQVYGDSVPKLIQGIT